MIREVFEFNRRTLSVHPKAIFKLDESHAAFCIKAIREEAQELEDETGLPDSRLKVVGQVDALIDAAYFAIGGLARIGLTEDMAVRCFLAVHDANMTKKLGTTHRGDMGVPDAAKGTNWVGPESRIHAILFGAEDAKN